MIDLEPYFKKLFELFAQHQEYFQAVSINTTYKDPFVKLYHLEQLASGFKYGREKILEEINNTRVKLMEYFEAHPEDSI